MVLAEMRKVFTRGSGIATLIIALVVGLGAVFVYWEISRAGEGGPSLNGTPLSQVVKASGIDASGAALTARNFFVLPLFLLLASASSVGGEFSDRTLRELVVRPVSRWSVLAAKILALSSLSLLSLVLTLVPSLALGTAVFGLHPADAGADAATVTALLGGYGASFLSDLGLLVIATAASLVLPSVGGTVVAVVLVLMLDKMVGWLLKLLGMMGVESAATLVPWTLGNALGCWEGWKDGWNPAQFGALAAFVAASSAFAVARFHRMDVP
jgi:ABC-2 type transport system permease protein